MLNGVRPRKSIVRRTRCSMNEVRAAALNAVSLINHVAVLGKTGSGKSSTAKVLLESVVMAPFKVLPPRRARVRARSHQVRLVGHHLERRRQEVGLPFHILGGPHGHVPLHSGAGRAIGELVGSGKLPLSIDRHGGLRGGRRAALLRRLRAGAAALDARRPLPRLGGGARVRAQGAERLREGEHGRSTSRRSSPPAAARRASASSWPPRRRSCCTTACSAAARR
jgi:hypothetical protein